MGMNDENAARLVFDVETAPLDGAAEYLEPADAPANYKDPIKIAEYIAKANADQLDKCSLDVDLCRVVAIAVQTENDPFPVADVVRGGEVDERSLIAAFWVRAAHLHLVGYNCLGFDLPVLLRRSLYLGIPAPHIQIDRFKHPRVTDLMDELSFNGKLKFRGLAFYCKRFGIDIPDGLTGADIAAAVKAERWAEIEAHVIADVRKTAVLASKLGYFHQVPEAVI